MIGIIQEQHPDRARLFMQWKNMDWPLLVDSLNLYGTKVVPMTLLIDEWGIVRHTRPRPADVETFLATRYPRPDNLADPPQWRDSDEELGQDAALADARFLGWQLATLRGANAEPATLSDALERYTAVLKDHPDDASVRFRLGVALRARFDSGEGEPGDFRHAVEQWSAALALDPNQYIWRRRIQQYGPRLDKPYPFYDWVEEARAAIRERGETPVELSVEPGGAEFAAPARAVETAAPDMEEPDPQGRIERDRQERDGGASLIELETVVVPNTSRPGSYRVHLFWRPNHARKAHWNNEAEPMKVWIDPPPGWRIDRRVQVIPNAAAATSRELRHVEFELVGGDESPPGPAKLRGYALYNVCEDETGVCMYRRSDLEVELRQ